MLSPAPSRPPSADEFDAAFAPWRARRILLAVSGGPDSMALAAAAVEWRRRAPGPPLALAIVDHGLRPGSRVEAQDAARRCAALGLPACILEWRGDKPAAALQEHARAARYALLVEAAREAGAQIVMTAHHADDQAETILFRLLRGSGPAGLAGMGSSTLRDGIEIARPFLAFPKARLVAFLAARGIDFARDPSNENPHFARARLRTLAPLLAAEGGDAALFARLARRIRRVEAALEAAAETARRDVARDGGFDAGAFFALPQELRLRLLRAALAEIDAAAPRLDRLEALEERLAVAHGEARSARLTLAGALVDLRGDRLTLRPAPPRRPETRGP